jgi:hypothetical protein
MRFMKVEEASHLQHELARLRQENARLGAMIYRLERRSADEPAGLGTETLIIAEVTASERLGMLY